MGNKMERLMLKLWYNYKLQWIQSKIKTEIFIYVTIYK